MSPRPVQPLLCGKLCLQKRQTGSANLPALIRSTPSSIFSLPALAIQFTAKADGLLIRQSVIGESNRPVISARVVRKLETVK